jgi:hypothetical protein
MSAATKMLKKAADAITGPSDVLAGATKNLKECAESHARLVKYLETARADEARAVEAAKSADPGSPIYMQRLKERALAVEFVKDLQSRVAGAELDLQSAKAAHSDAERADRQERAEAIRQRADTYEAKLDALAMKCAEEMSKLRIDQKRLDAEAEKLSPLPASSTRGRSFWRKSELGNELTWSQYVPAMKERSGLIAMLDKHGDPRAERLATGEEKGPWEK